MNIRQELGNAVIGGRVSSADDRSFYEFLEVPIDEGLSINWDVAFSGILDSLTIN